MGFGFLAQFLSFHVTCSSFPSWCLGSGPNLGNGPGIILQPPAHTHPAGLKYPLVIYDTHPHAGADSPILHLHAPHSWPLRSQHASSVTAHRDTSGSFGAQDSLAWTWPLLWGRCDTAASPRLMLSTGHPMVWNLKPGHAVFMSKTRG